MAPSKPHRKKSVDGDMGEGDDIVLRVTEAVADERVAESALPAAVNCLESSPK